MKNKFLLILLLAASVVMGAQDKADLGPFEMNNINILESK